MKILPSPDIANSFADPFNPSRPIMAICDNSGTFYNSVNTLYSYCNSVNTLYLYLNKLTHCIFILTQHTLYLYRNSENTLY